VCHNPFRTAKILNIKYIKDIEAKCAGAHLESQALERLRQEDHEFAASLSCKAKLSQKNNR
jgi:hypothetical protein